MAEALAGEWKSFVFKLIEPEDHPKVLEHLRNCFYYNAFHVFGYTKELDDEMEILFTQILNDGSNMSFIALDKATGKIAGCRITFIEYRDPKPTGESPFKHLTLKAILSSYNKLKDECNVFERYKVDSYPHMFGISVNPEFTQQGLAIEIYRRSKDHMKAMGFSVTLVCFISPYSRAAAKHHGFIQLAKIDIIDVLDADGNILNPQADPKNFMDHGVFELN